MLKWTTGPPGLSSFLAAQHQQALHHNSSPAAPQDRDRQQPKPSPAVSLPRGLMPPSSSPRTLSANTASGSRSLVQSPAMAPQWTQHKSKLPTLATEAARDLTTHLPAAFPRDPPQTLASLLHLLFHRQNTEATREQAFIAPFSP